MKMDPKREAEAEMEGPGVGDMMSDDRVQGSW